MRERSTVRMTIAASHRSDTARVRAASRTERVVADALAEAGARVLRLETLSVEPRGDAVVTGVAATIDGPPGDRSRIVYVDETHEPVALWVHPDDPWLPGLGSAAYPHALAVLLGRLGLPDRVDRVDLVAYRPARRAVVRAVVGGAAVYVKVVRPERVESIARGHRALAEAGIPVPSLLGWSPSGLVVLAAARGTPLVDMVATIEADAAIRAVDDLRRRLAAVTVPAGRPTGSVAARADWYAGRLAERLPWLAERLEPLVATARRAAHPEGPLATVHGDLHAGQVFLDDSGSGVVGLIDVDTAGPGAPGVDVGAFVAHAHASSVLSAGGGGDAGRAEGFRRLAAAGEHAWLTEAPGSPADGAGQAVGQLLAQAMQTAVARDDPDGAEHLVRVAERIATAGAAGEDPLIPDSPAPHRSERT
jgi:hypothetical protein